ncbi:hypothetical protein NQZ79_g6563 [Umbelopsis isabellina]|nr:hypothetical protein NQZ79_g6563 [Umbelopsis isabellina]
MFLGYKTIKKSAPVIARTLSSTSRILSPIARYLSNTYVIGPIISAIIRVSFFMWFCLLLSCDVLIRSVLRQFVGYHPTGKNYCKLSPNDLVPSLTHDANELFWKFCWGSPLAVINAMNKHLDLFDDTIPRTSNLESGEKFRQRKRATDTKDKHLSDLLRRPRYSLPLAYTLGVASRLAYEDVDVIKYELKRAGFDVENTFRPVAYKPLELKRIIVQNICAFIAEKDDDILLVFRGTNPLNMANYMTNINMSKAEVNSPYIGYMGKVHKGFWEAMGDPLMKRKPSNAQNENIPSGSTVNIELSGTSVSRTIWTAVKAILQIIKFLTFNISHHVRDPVDSRWLGGDVDLRSQNLFVQAESWIMSLIERDLVDDLAVVPEAGETDSSSTDEQAKKSKRRSGDTATNMNRRSSKARKSTKRLFITGHSLGGALSTIFLAKMLQSNSELLQIFAGLYTFGHPKIADNEFAKTFSPRMSSKIFHHAYNNDIVTRIPSHDNYSSPPGTLVFIDSGYNIALYPPNPLTNEPVPIRPISFLHLSGLLNRHIIARLVSDSLVRIILRIVFPFFVNDHFPSDYCEALRKGKINWVVIGEGGISAGDETDEGIRMTPTKQSSGQKGSRRLNVMVGSASKRGSWPAAAT